VDLGYLKAIGQRGCFKVEGQREKQAPGGITGGCGIYRKPEEKGGGI